MPDQQRVLSGLAREVRIENDRFVPEVVDQQGDFFRTAEAADGGGFWGGG